MTDIPSLCESVPDEDKGAWVTWNQLIKVWDRVIERVVPGLSRNVFLGALDEFAEHIGVKRRCVASDEWILVKVGEAETVESLATDNIRLRAELETERRKVEVLRDAVEFYAEPDCYFAFMFMADEPCGEFLQDFDENHSGNYNRPMPGKTARAALAALTSTGK